LHFAHIPNLTIQKQMADIERKQLRQRVQTLMQMSGSRADEAKMRRLEEVSAAAPRSRIFNIAASSRPGLEPTE
jgi:hypothetical protein